MSKWDKFANALDPEYHEHGRRERLYKDVENSGSKRERQKWIKLQAQIAQDKARGKKK